jgi:anti-anti-sigma regulatory factor
MLKIQRTANGRVVFTLSGRIETEDVEELQQLLALETAGQQLVLDLRNVTLVNQDVVTFLASCEADSTTIENCPAYIREWIERGKSRTRRRRTR